MVVDYGVQFQAILKNVEREYPGIYFQIYPNQSNPAISELTILALSEAMYHGNDDATWTQQALNKGVMIQIPYHHISLLIDKGAWRDFLIARIEEVLNENPT